MQPASQITAVAFFLVQYFLTNKFLLAEANEHASGYQPLWSNSFGVPFVNATYDYVIIGGGTAGLAVAWKLALSGKYEVAVVEAGGFYEQDNGNGSVIPGLAPLQHLGWNSNHPAPLLIDWGFVTEPQKGLDDRSLFYARGKTLGGSSARAHGAFMRGTKGTYQKWAEEAGDPSYEFEQLLPYFKDSCTLTAPNHAKRWPPNGSVLFDEAAYATTTPGPLQISWPNWAIPLGTWGASGFQSIGLSHSKTGFSSGILEGHGWIPGTINPVDSHRSSSQSSFLKDAMLKTSLKVYTRAQATKILFDQTTATGLEVRTEGVAYSLSARKEVILSAGAFQSPHLLMLSGIGPSNHLRSHGIPVVHDLPGVGQNLHDKTYVGTGFRVNVETSSSLVNSPQYAAKAARDFLNSQTGPLTNGPAYVAFERLPSSSLSPSAQAALQNNFSPDGPHVEYLIENGFSGNNSDYLTADPKDGYNYGTISAAISTTLSRGNISLRSNDPLQPPVINPNYYSNPIDMELAIIAFNQVRKIWAGMANVTIGPEYYPGTAAVSTDSEIERYIRQNSIMIWHASAACKMGMANDSMAVVDSKARVFGVKRLRVVDVSAFPFLPPGHPQGTVYALALKIADDILRDAEVDS
ncbi:GMC oxidoreductase [Zasmidium cellare ATCC 36951]|uniref:GMC oxidoreductase n=1 Tax=Zasmidium cellare ATCC 36951 TaxID=1080233 RepID=A0A6A6C1L6_ZASCE|nr:GMC oxidoreductase [Zasmidium cellare ATCC 36951]KAF2160947.1 GMC oxidoreductase [Zasmidium cellare ATCC 36951]